MQWNHSKKGCLYSLISPIAKLLVLVGPTAILALAQSASAQQTEPPPTERITRRANFTAAQMFAFAAAAFAKGDVYTAEAAYKALANDFDRQIRTEARFRHGMMLAGLGRLVAAAVLFRRILDEQPNAQRVRLELARVLDRLGDEAGARRALREVQAGGLPPEVAGFVDRYSAALRAKKALGLSFEVALAPDSNINRATRSDRLGTVLGDFTLDGDAKERSGIGVALSGQAYARTAVSSKMNLLARVSATANIYRASQFDDIALGISAGPELSLGSDRLNAEAGISGRWFGGQRYATTKNLAFNYLHPLGRRSQLRAAAEIGVTANHRNALENGHSYAMSLSYERALSSRSGLGVTLSANRQALRDPGYSSVGGHLSVFVYRDFGALTVIGSLGYARLEADRRLALYPRRRIDNLYRATLGATFRQLTVGGFAPLVRVTAERNRSSSELFDYRRVRTEFGITRTF
jgi:hypothetical protein